MSYRIEDRLKGAEAPNVGEATRRLARRASDEGLPEMAYATVDTPFGPLLAATTPRGLVRMSFAAHRTADAVLDVIAARISPRVMESPATLDDVRRQLDEYFEGARRRFDLRIDWRLAGPFQRKVLRRTAAIPYGGYLTYAEVAAEAGSPRGARAAGNALAGNPVPVVVPCHRVLASGGGLGGYGGGIEMKKRLLRLEGAL
jgi:methylated-DNA-[protein]-cysteine S-methyltransferase